MSETMSQPTIESTSHIDAMTATPEQLDLILAAHGASVEEASEGPIEFKIVEQTGPEGDSISNDPNTTEVLPATEVETINASPRPSRLLSGMRKFLGNGEKSAIAAADEAKDDIQQDDAEVDGSADKSRKEKRAEKREQRDAAIRASIDDQGNALPRAPKEEKAPKEKRESKLGNKVRAFRNRSTAVVSPEDEDEAALRGTEIEQIVYKNGAKHVYAKDGDKLKHIAHDDVLSAYGYQDRKSEEASATSETAVEVAETVVPVEKEIDITPEYETEFLNTLTEDDFNDFNNLSVEDQDKWIRNWISDEKHSTENLPSNITSEVIDEFLNELSENNYSDFKKLSTELQDKWILDWYKDEKGPVDQVAGTVDAVAEDQSSDERKKGKLRTLPTRLATAATIRMNEFSQRRAEKAETGEKMSGKKKAILAGLGAVAAVGVGAYVANRYGINTGGGGRSAAEGGLDADQAGTIVANKAEKASSRAAALAEFRRGERAADVVVKAQESLGISPSTIAKAQELSDGGEYTWTVANALSPGKSSQAMEFGIDKYNELNGTDFAHIGDKIVNGAGRQVNTTEMRFINQLMIDELS